MRPIAILAVFFVGSGLADAAVPAVIPLPPPPAAQAQPPQPACSERNSADYVPGVDAYGRAVAPADLPGSSTDVQVSTQVFAQVRTANPQLKGVGVAVNLPGLQAPPPCPAKAAASSITIH